MIDFLLCRIKICLKEWRNNKINNIKVREKPKTKKIHSKSHEEDDDRNFGKFKKKKNSLRGKKKDI